MAATIARGQINSPRRPPVILGLLGVDGEVVRRGAVLPCDDATADGCRGKNATHRFLQRAHSLCRSFSQLSSMPCQFFRSSASRSLIAELQECRSSSKMKDISVAINSNSTGEMWFALAKTHVCPRGPELVCQSLMHTQTLPPDGDHRPVAGGRELKHARVLRLLALHGGADDEPQVVVGGALAHGVAEGDLVGSKEAHLEAAVR